MLLHLSLYLLIVASLVWARLRFFRVNKGTSLPAALVYDGAVTVQILVTLYYMISSPQISPLLFYVSAASYLGSLLLFWWSIRTAKSLDFAFSDSVGRIITSGPFRIVRHPFYVSYIVVWLTSSLLFNSPMLWITLLCLMTFYFLSASKEERVILESSYSGQYSQYIEDVGMFLPRIMKWVPSSSGRWSQKKK